MCVSWELGDERTRIRINDKIFISALEQKITAGDVCEIQRSASIQPCGGGIISYSARIAVKREIFGGGCSKANAQKANTGTKYAKTKKAINASDWNDTYSPQTSSTVIL